MLSNVLYFKQYTPQLLILSGKIRFSTLMAKLVVANLLLV